MKKKFSEFIFKFKESFSQAIHNPTFTLKEQLGFASGMFGNTMGQDMVGTFLVLFLTDYMGIKTGVVTVLMLVAKIVNIVGDPVAGAILDRPGGNSKRGKARPFLLFSPFPIAVTSVFLFVVPSLSYQSRLIYVFVFYLVYCISDTFYDMSLMTVSARMTNNPKDRKNFYTVAEFASTLGSMLPGGVIPLILSIPIFEGNYVGQKNVYLISTIIFAAVGLAMMVIPYFTLREKTLDFKPKKEKVNLNFKAILHNKPLLLLSSAMLVDSIRQVCYGALTYFYFKTLNAPWVSTVTGVISSTLSYVGIALVPFLGRKFSPRDLVIFGYAYTGIFYLFLLLTGYKSLALVTVIIGISGATSGLVRTSRRVLIADSTDYMEWKTWKKYGVPIRSEGMVFAVSSMANRISGFGKDLLLPLGLTAVGYISATVLPDGSTVEAVQSAKTLQGIFYLVTIPGVVGSFVPALIVLFDNYTGKRRDNILHELNEMREARLAELEANETGPQNDRNGTPNEAIVSNP